jgi:hypothetical protein
MRSYKKPDLLAIGSMSGVRGCRKDKEFCVFLVWDEDGRVEGGNIGCGNC